MKRTYFVSYQELDENYKVLGVGNVIYNVRTKIKELKHIEELQDRIREYCNCKSNSYIHILSINYLG